MITGNNAERNWDHESPPILARRHTQEEHSAMGDVDQASHGEHMHRLMPASQEHAAHSAEMFRRKFWGALLLSVPTLASAPVVQRWFGHDALEAPMLSRWVPAV